MSIFSSPEQRWIKANKLSLWNRMFSDLPTSEAMLTKLMVFECVEFSDTILNSSILNGSNAAARIDSILLAKLQFYHLVTKSPTIHNLFYGYMFEVYTKYYKEDLETAHSYIDRMRSIEHWNLIRYYDFFERKTGDFKKVLDEYCSSIDKNETTDGTKLLAVSVDDFKHFAASELSKMHLSFISQMKDLR